MRQCQRSSGTLKLASEFAELRAPESGSVQKNFKFLNWRQ
jgi:hypothetical protein